MRKSVAITAAPSSTCTATSPSAANHAASSGAIASGSSGMGARWTIAAATRRPGARACQCAGKISASAGSNGRAGWPGVKPA